MIDGRRWSGVRGSTGFDLDLWKGEIFLDGNDKLSKQIRDRIYSECPQIEDFDRLEINWLSSGYYQPIYISMYPEKSYPEEGDEDRELESVEIHLYRGFGKNLNITIIKLSDYLAKEIFNTLEDEINDTEL